MRTWDYPAIPSVTWRVALTLLSGVLGCVPRSPTPGASRAAPEVTTPAPVETPSTSMANPDPAEPEETIDTLPEETPRLEYVSRTPQRLVLEGRFVGYVTRPEIAGEEAAPTVVALHGMCNDPSITCGWFQRGELSEWFQVCPRGAQACGGNLYRWSGRPDADVADALAAAHELYPTRWDTSRRVLVGTSQGAFAALQVLRRSTGQFRGLVLIASSAAPDATQLREAGVRKVAFLCGDRDQARPAMQLAAKRLTQAGVPTRFWSLGNVAHEVPDATSPLVASATAWTISE
jgi:predicted esterase